MTKRNKQKRVVHIFFSAKEKELLETAAMKKDTSEGAIIKKALKEHFDRENVNGESTG